MRKKLGIAIAVLAAASIAAGSITFASAASPAPTNFGAWGRPAGWGRSISQPASLASHVDGETIIVTTRETNSKNIDVDGRGFTPGDYFVLREKVFNRRGTRQVGYDNVQCTAHFPFSRNRVTSLCEGTFTFTARGFHGQGTITFQGLVSFTQTTGRFDIAVTGGTGHFQNARGELHATNRGLVFHLIP